MSFRRDLLVSFGLQGVGAASVLLATLLLGARLGPEVQGGFSRVKAEVEFVAAFAMFGLPQALFFHVKSGRLGSRAALRWGFGAAAVAMPVAAFYAAWRDEPVAAWALMAGAIGANVAHAQLRALLLVGERTAWFNVITALPQLLVLVLVGVAVAAGVGSSASAPWLAIFGLAYAVAAAIAWLRLRGVPASAPPTEASWRALGRYGLAAWSTAVLATAGALLVQHWVEVGRGRVALGQFTMAMTLMQAPLTPISYAAPLLFRRWMERPGEAASRRAAGLVCALLLGAAALCALAAPVRPDLCLGPAYAGATAALAVLLAGGAAEAASRVLAVQASARGQPGIAVLAEAARWSVLALAWLVLDAPGLVAICAAWSVGAWAAAGTYLKLSRGDGGELAS